jgi:hypothetical protein
VWDLIARLVQWLRRARRVDNLGVLIMAKDVLFTWKRPTQRQAGGPLDPARIDGTEIAIRVGGFPDWTVLGVAAGQAEEFEQTQLDFGTYEARAVVLTDGGQRGQPAVLAFEILDDSAAVAVVDFAVQVAG